jgi:hypothetical protein
MTTQTEEIIVSDTIVEEQQTEQEVPQLLRTYRQGVFEIYNGVWGSYIVPTIDPDANIVEITDKELKLFDLKKDIHRIPNDIWSAWINLVFYFADKINKNVEVSVRILRSEEDESKYRLVLPLQEVSGARVNAGNFQKSIDIVSGEVLESYPPAGWYAVGSSHSHNTMNPFFSGVDDQYELTDPGLHIVVGSINHTKNEYDLKASVTGNRRRFMIDEDSVIDLEPNDDVTYHPDVIKFVSTQFGKFFQPAKPAIKQLPAADKNKDKKSTWNTWNFNKNKSNRVDDDERGDPFEYDAEGFGNKHSYTTSDFASDIESLVADFLDESQNDVGDLCALLDTLQDCMHLVESQLNETKQFFGE